MRYIIPAMTSKVESAPDGNLLTRINVLGQTTLTADQNLKLTGSNKSSLNNRIFMGRALKQSSKAESRDLSGGWGAKADQTRADLQEEHKNNLEDPTKI